MEHRTLEYRMKNRVELSENKLITVKTGRLLRS